MVITKLTFLARALTVSPKRRSGPRRLPVFRANALLNWRAKLPPPNRPYISQGWGPQRHANGEIATRAISMLAILTGNVGINGGNSGARGPRSLPFERMPTLENPVETSISMFMWTDAIERGPE